jgi:hypothetical protein
LIVIREIKCTNIFTANSPVMEQRYSADTVTTTAAAAAAAAASTATAAASQSIVNY